MTLHDVGVRRRIQREAATGERGRGCGGQLVKDEYDGYVHG